MSVDAQTPPYSKEFKREAVQLLRTSGRPIPQLAKGLAVSPQSLRNWANQRAVDRHALQATLPPGGRLVVTSHT
jgi:transposase